MKSFKGKTAIVAGGGSGIGKELARAPAAEGANVVITASAPGITLSPAMAAYNVTKAGMVGLGETLRMELAVHNIGVSVLCPGIIKTNIVRDGKIHFEGNDGVGSRVTELYATKGTDPSIVPEDRIRALKRDIGIMPTPLHACPLYILKRISPSLYQRIGRAQWKKGKAFVMPVIEST